MLGELVGRVARRRAEIDAEIPERVCRVPDQAGAGAEYRALLGEAVEAVIGCALQAIVHAGSGPGPPPSQMSPPPARSPNITPRGLDNRSSILSLRSRSACAMELWWLERGRGHSLALLLMVPRRRVCSDSGMPWLQMRTLAPCVGSCLAGEVAR